MKILILALFMIVSSCDPAFAQEPERETVDVFFYYTNGYWPEDVQKSTEPPDEEVDRYLYWSNRWEKEEWSLSCPSDDNGNDYIECPQSYGPTDGIDRGIYDGE